ncbi:MAG: tRNA (guanosine(37)-N1)-methyltransferase TrmD [Proteobacteria bacterium]|nr:tRNA (guanosine(37)-N1)-methyltransferase TrmD [Pseudomonadota bacterium]
MYHATVVTLFPEMFPGALGFSIPGRAQDKGIWSLDTVQIRDFAVDKHQSVDDTPFGGGQGMVIRPDVVNNALLKATSLSNANRKILFTSPRGKPLTQEVLRKNLKEFPDGAIILCGRYEGIDQRVIDYWHQNHGLEEFSIGDYILSGGEIAAQVYLDSTIRLLPDALGAKESSMEESFELDLLEFFHYTRPHVWNGIAVPDVLLSGHHANIKKWRHQQAEEITKALRPDMWETYLKKRKSAF